MEKLVRVCALEAFNLLTMFWNYFYFGTVFFFYVLTPQYSRTRGQKQIKMYSRQSLR